MNSTCRLGLTVAFTCIGLSVTGRAQGPDLLESAVMGKEMGLGDTSQ